MRQKLTSYWTFAAIASTESSYEIFLFLGYLPPAYPAPPALSAAAPCTFPLPFVSVSLKYYLYSALYSAFCFFNASCLSPGLSDSFPTILSFKSFKSLAPRIVSLLWRRNSLNFLLLIYYNFNFYMMELRISLFLWEMSVLQLFSLLNWASTCCLYLSISFSFMYFNSSFWESDSFWASLEVVRYWLPLGFSWSSWLWKFWDLAMLMPRDACD